MAETNLLFYVETEIPVRTYDIDALGHVSNIVYIRWLEDLRLKMLETHLPLEELMAENISPILLRTEINYIRPITLFERPLGRCHISSVDHLRLELTAEFAVDGEVRARAKQYGIFFDFAKKRPARFPKSFRRKYDSFLAGH